MVINIQDRKNIRIPGTMKTMNAEYNGCLTMEYTPWVHGTPSLNPFMMVNTDIAQRGIPAARRMIPAALKTHVGINETMKSSGYREVRRMGMMEYAKESTASFGPTPQIVIFSDILVSLLSGVLTKNLKSSAI